MTTARRRRRRGFSLMMVTAVVAVATVMGLSILANNTLQAEASSSQDKAVGADALAESGVNLGLYYLQNLHDSTKCPAAIPALTTAGNYSQSNNTLGAAVPGKFNLRFTRPSLLQYQIVSTGIATAGAADVSRTLTALADVDYYGYAIMAPNATAALTIPSGTTVTGNVLAPSGSAASGDGGGGGGGLLGGLVGGLLKTVTDVLGITQVPSTAAVNHYLNYNINGVSGTATLILLGTLSNETRGPVPGNPAGVYYTLGNLDMNGNVKINGTLIMSSGGQLRVQGTGNSITPQRYFPAVVSDSDIKLKSANTTLDINGLTYTGGNISKAGTGSNYVMNVTGTLLFAGATPTIDPGVTLKVVYDRQRASIPSLTGAVKPIPTGYTIVNWKNQN
jgi:hypothetical protein